jgi:hypothetical protein
MYKQIKPELYKKTVEIVKKKKEDKRKMLSVNFSFIKNNAVIFV